MEDTQVVDQLVQCQEYWVYLHQASPLVEQNLILVTPKILSLANNKQLLDALLLLDCQQDPISQELA